MASSTRSGCWVCSCVCVLCAVAQRHGGRGAWAGDHEAAGGEGRAGSVAGDRGHGRDPDGVERGRADLGLR
eukprot:1982708-Rhodomonas_salina.3